MRRGQWAGDLDRLRAASREGVISASDLVRLGVSESTVYRRTHTDGPWSLLLPATILLGSGPATSRQMEIAALVHAGPQAVLTGLGAARLHGLHRGGDPDGNHVLIPITQKVQSVGSVTVERTRRMPKPWERHGLPVAPLARCLIDHVRRIKEPDTIAALLTEPVQRQMLLVEHLVAELDAASRKGTAAPRAVLRAMQVGAESPTEVDFYELWTSLPDLPAIRSNVPVFTLDGRFVAKVDFLVEELGFVWECDSVEEHFATPAQVHATAERARALRELGFYVLSTRPTQCRDDARGVEADIRYGLSLAGRTPAPRATFGCARAA